MALILWPVSLLYWVVSRVVFVVRRVGAYKSRRQIICVGNIMAGGVGKTPIVREIAHRLGVPVVMRGYKARVGDIGDEAKMLAASGVAVHTGCRKSNLMLLNRQRSNKPIVMDDGLQNPSIKKDVSIMVFDAGLGVGNGFMLPAGPLREPRRAMRRADAIIVIDSAAPSRRLKLPAGVPVFHAVPRTVNPYSDDVALVAFAGIGYPKKFFNALGGRVVATRSFADHYQYTDADLDALFKLADKKGAKLVTTEKDWVRLPADARKKIKFAPLQMDLDAEFFNWLQGRIK